jgi:hypothetical protein
VAISLLLTILAVAFPGDSPYYVYSQVYAADLENRLLKDYKEGISSSQEISDNERVRNTDVSSFVTQEAAYDT